MFETLSQLQAALASKAISSRELTEQYLARIDRYDGQLNSLITTTADVALAQADAADARIAQGQAGALTGIPLVHKDLFNTQGVRTTCGSRYLENYVSPFDSTVVAKLKDAGMVMLAKANMDEFAMGSDNASSYYGAVKNPWNLDKVPGGSSGGSAAAVAAGLTPVATGTDTGGSIRQPACFTGISGIKPTYGRISRWGMVAYASSFDQAGPLARTAEDLALMLNAMCGFDEKDSTSLDMTVPDFTAQLNQPLSGLRMGVPKEYFAQGLDNDVASQIHNALSQYEKLGATLVEVSLPNKDLAVPAYYVLAPSEASSNLARFDGVRYGHRCKNPRDLQDLYMRSRAEGFGSEVQRRIMVGAYALSAGYYDAYYLKAQKIRRIIKNDFMQAFAQCDVIVGPVSPTVAWDLGSKSADPVAMYLEDIYTVPVNLAGLPAMSIPVGFAQGMPVGLHLIGNYLDEARLLNVAHQYQLHTDWHLQTPANFA